MTPTNREVIPLSRGALGIGETGHLAIAPRTKAEIQDADVTESREQSRRGRLARAYQPLIGLCCGDAFGERFFIPEARSLIDQRAVPAPPWIFKSSLRTGSRERTTSIVTASCKSRIPRENEKNGLFAQRAGFCARSRNARRHCLSFCWQKR